VIVAERPVTRQVEDVCAVVDVDDELEDEVLALVAFVVVELDDPPPPPPQAARPIARLTATTTNLNLCTADPLSLRRYPESSRFPRTGTVAR
jgi:hypothetical protein